MSALDRVLSSLGLAVCGIVVALPGIAILVEGTAR